VRCIYSLISLSALFRSLSRRKNPLSISLLSCCKIPSVISTRWFSRSSQERSKSEPAAPARGSRQA